MNGTGHINSSSDDWVFDLSGTPAKPTLANDGELVSLLGENDRWMQYNNELVYQLDCLVRDWIAVNSKHAKWVQNYRKRRYTMSMIYEQIFGKPYDNDMKVAMNLSKILAYYSSKIQKGAWLQGKMRSKTVYTISPRRLKKPPYSLRLRLEWFAEQGIIPTYTNMCLPKDSLKPGHARNKKTDANMKARSERAKARYNERYGNRPR